jgi:fermentation-respiration switch protein FrsA (DUF1100 family)
LKPPGAEFRFGFQIDRADDKAGTLSGKLISIDENGLQIPYKTATLEGNKLILDMPLVKAKYTGTLDEAGKKITGEYEQRGVKTPLDLERVEKLPEVKRPQHPKPPFPYLVEDVKFENAGAKIELAGTLTLPKGEGPFPAVVLVTGSGPQDRDETIFGHKPFLVLADHLTKAGIAVLRYDDRGIGRSGGQFAGSTSADFATDAYAGVQYLLARKEIDPKRIGVCGHSEGGMIAPMLAADHPTEIAFIVLLAGPGESGGTIIKTQNLDVARKSKATEKDLEIMVEMFDAIMPLLASDLTPEKLREALREKIEETIKKLPDEAKRKEASDKMEIMLKTFSAPWMRYFMTYDPVLVLKKVKCPVLAVNGAKDTQVRSKENLALIAGALKAGGNEKVVVKEFPEMNHLFQKCNTGELAEYGKIEETLNPEVLKTVSEWIAGLGK